MQAYPVTPRQIRLAAGQSFRFQASAGARLIVTCGSIEVCEPPACLGEHVVMQRFTLRDGAQHLFLQRGWVTIQAQEPAELLCVAPETRFAASACMRFLENCVTFCLRRIRLRRPA